MTKKTKIILLALAVIVVALLVMCCNQPESVLMCSVIPMATIGNINSVNDREVSGNSIDYRVYLLSLDQIDRSVAFPTANESRELSNIPLVSGQYWHYIEGHTYPTDESTLEKGDLTVAPTNKFSMIAGSNSPQVLDFIENHAGGRFIIVYYDFVESRHLVLGSIHYPMVLKSITRSRNKERKAVDLNFENNAFAQPLVYVGQLTTSTPTNVAGTTLTVSPSSSEYVLTGTEAIATITGVTANDIGRTILIKGSDGATISESENFILQNGTKWTANAGSKIEFKIYDSQPTLIEIHKSRIQTT